LAATEQALDSASSEVLRGGAEVIERVRERWRTLCGEVASEPFFDPEWVAAHVRAFEPNSEVILLTASANRRLAAVLPLVRKTGRFAGMTMRTLTGVVNSHSVRVDLLRTPGPAGDEAIESIWSTLRRVAGWHVLELYRFPTGGCCESLLSLAARDGYRTFRRAEPESPLLRMQRDGAGRYGWLGGTNSHFRHELRRFARLLEAEMGEKPILVRRDDGDPELLASFFDLEAAGWKGREGSAISCRPETRAFYTEIARVARDLACFCLHSLEVKGKMLAAAFSVVTRDCYYPLKIAYDERLQRCGPGHVLINGILEECAGKGIPQLYFGGTTERWKTAWTSGVQPHATGFVFNTGYFPRLIFAVKATLVPALGRARRALRRRVAGNHSRGSGKSRKDRS
jgi:CelD/BcsL family acetyltransferase involved in cellulose biosynthesis